MSYGVTPWPFPIWGAALSAARSRVSRDRKGHEGSRRDTLVTKSWHKSGTRHLCALASRIALASRWLVSASSTWMPSSRTVRQPSPSGERSLFPMHRTNAFFSGSHRHRVTGSGRSLGR